MDRIPAHAAVAETVSAAKEVAPRAAGLVNAVLRRVAAKEERPGRVVLPAGSDPLGRLALETSHPEWLVRRWAGLLGEEAARRALAADDEDSPLDLLADPRLGGLEEIEAGLRASGVETVRSPWAPLALTVTSGDAAREPRVASGAIAVVDAAAQAMVEAVPPAEVVVDLAAAPGGKTRTLLARGIARKVVALERTPSRARRLASNLRAAGRRAEAVVLLADATRPPLPRGAFASVLLDAPCSGTGTLRKNPEIRLRLREEDLARFAADAAGAPSRRPRPPRAGRDARLGHLLARARGERACRRRGPLGAAGVRARRARSRAPPGARRRVPFPLGRRPRAARSDERRLLAHHDPTAESIAPSGEAGPPRVSVDNRRGPHLHSLRISRGESPFRSRAPRRRSVSMAGKAEIVDAIASDAGMTKASATQALDAVVNYLQQALKKGERVGVPGLGNFSVADRKARAGINPQTKEPIRIAAAKAVRFRPGKDLKELLNKKKK